MTVAVLWFAIAGLLLGGAISFRMQKKPWWSSVLLLVVAAGVVWFAFANIEAARASGR